VKAQEVSRKYATAVFSLALEKWLIPLNAVQERLADSPQRVEDLQNETHSFSQRQKELDDIIPANSEESVRNFLYTLLKNGDIGLLDNILADLERMTRGGPQVQIAHITTSIALSDSDKENFRQKLRAQYGDNLEFVFNVDRAIIGGVTVQIGDKVIDGSVATRLDAMSKALGVKR
jgi:F-type H+-transporting ATPase subunit delta